MQINDIKNRIFTLRGVQIMIDSDLAVMYQVSTGRLNEQVKRNIERFPDDFMFQLTKQEWLNLKSQNAISSWGGRRKLPNAFTEQGIASLSGILKSEKAAKVNIEIMRAFVEMRKILFQGKSLFHRLENLEQKQLQTDLTIDSILAALENDSFKSNEGIFFDGQIFDAWVFATDLVKTAQKSIVLIDNYVDEQVLLLLSKRNKNVSAKIYSKNLSKQFRLDLKKHNSQYPEIQVHKFSDSHDRFLIIDEKEIYHIGASLKDLGKKWFAFSKINISVDKILENLPK